MEKMSKITASLSLCVMLVSLVVFAGCSSNAGNSTTESSEQGKGADVENGQAADKLVLRMGGTQTPSHPATAAAKDFAQMVNDTSNGQIEAKVMFGGVLGGEREITEAVQLGNVEMGWLSDVGMATVVPEIGFAYLPYLNTSYEQVENNYYNGWIGEEVKKRLAAKGIQLLAFMDNDFRWVTNSVHPVLKPADIKGMSIRVPEIPELIQFFDELGAMPTTMAVTEVVTALQQGAVDGQDNGAILNYTYGFYEFQPYMTITNHVFSGGGVVINKELWDGLSPERQKIILEAATEIVPEGNQISRANVSKYTQAMIDAGTQIDEPTPELVAAMEEAGRKVWENPDNVERYGKEVMDKILNR